MKKFARISLLFIIATGLVYASYADRGIGKKKARVILNIKSPSSFNSAFNFNLRNGFKYTGSMISSPATANGSNTLITYQKGSSVYIIPYKQKIFVADVKQGFAGTKLVIKVP